MSKLHKSTLRTDKLNPGTIVDLTDEKIMAFASDITKEEKKITWGEIVQRLQNVLQFTSDQISNDSTEVAGDNVTQALDSLDALIDLLQPAFSCMVVTQRDINDPSPLQIAVTGTGSDTLNPPTGYVQVTGFDPIGIQEGVTYDPVTSELVIEDAGWYEAKGWASFRHSQNNSTVAFLFGFRPDDQSAFTYSTRPVANKKPNLNDLGIAFGFGEFYATPGTRLSVHIASNNSGTVTVANAHISAGILRRGPQ